jgi:hypothetical protein
LPSEPTLAFLLKVSAPAETTIVAAVATATAAAIIFLTFIIKTPFEFE